MDDQITDREGGGMTFFDNQWPGPFDHKFSFVEEIGCIPSLIGFVLFLAVLTILLQVVFN
jgi:hypothetical protein